VHVEGDKEANLVTIVDTTDISQGRTTHRPQQQSAAVEYHVVLIRDHREAPERCDSDDDSESA